MTALESLRTADRESLISRWRDLFNFDPPPRVHIGLIRGVLAWHVQCEASGMSISSLSKSAAPARLEPPAVPALRSGTRLLREWRGATHEVRVVANGFEYAGQTYKSLSRIARTITGTPWSGPVFFGVKR